MLKRHQVNNEALNRLWNDPQVRELQDSVKAIHPDWELADNEVVVDYDHLTEAVTKVNRHTFISDLGNG
jgi:hypothetical protein